jgi:hypothetical protein
MRCHESPLRHVPRLLYLKRQRFVAGSRNHLLYLRGLKVIYTHLADPAFYV